MLQPAAWVGVHGLTLATLLLAATPALGRRAMAAAAAVLVLWAGAGVARLRLAAPPPAPGLDGGAGAGQRAAGPQMGSRLRHGHLPALPGADPRRAWPGDAGPAVVVWPETASPFLLEQDADARAAIAAAAGGAPALVGSVRFDARGGPTTA